MVFDYLSSAAAVWVGFECLNKCPLVDGAVVFFEVRLQDNMSGDCSL